MFGAIRRVSIIGALVVPSLMLTVGPAGAAEPPPTNNTTVDVVEFFGEFGFNPCRNGNDAGLVSGIDTRQIEIEAGRVNSEANSAWSVDVQDGFVADFHGHDSAQIDASGNGKVEIDIQVFVSNDDTGERFEVHAFGLLTIENGGVAAADIQEDISDCERG